MPDAKPTPQPHLLQQQQQQTQATSKVKKVEWYASHLVSEAVAKEKAGRTGDATVDYLQAADLFLLLAKGQQDYTSWKAFTDRAMSCQQRVRLLIASKSSEKQ